MIQSATDEEEQQKLELWIMIVSVVSINTAILPFFVIVMVIGFSQRIVTISEAIVQPGEHFNVAASVATLRTAEREHPMLFRLQQSTRSAIVEPFGSLENPLFDAIFGT